MADINGLVAGYRKLRDKKAQLEAAHKVRVAPINEMMDKIEAELLAQCTALGVNSFNTPDGTAYRSTATYAKVTDWEAVLKYIQEHAAWELLERRVAKSEATARTEAGETLPGIEITQEYKIGVQAPRKKSTPQVMEAA